jgi:hypothetical protein
MKLMFMEKGGWVFNIGIIPHHLYLDQQIWTKNKKKMKLGSFGLNFLNLLAKFKINGCVFF